MRNGSGSVRRGGTSSNETGNRPARRLSPPPGRGSLHALSASRRMEWLFLLNVPLVFLAGGVVCLLLTVVATIVALTLFFGAPVSETIRPWRSRWRLITLPWRMASRRLFTGFVLRQPLPEDKACYAPGLRRARRCARAGLVVCSACRRVLPRCGKMRRRGRAGRPPAAPATRPERPIRGERWIP